jgi:hypothetical protein
MAKHQLSLEIPNTLNGCIFRVIDTSIYSDEVPVECPKLEITPPGFYQAYDVPNLTENFTENITACDMGLQIYNCTIQYNDLPDGVYVVRYSVSPNDKVYVEYNHLRITRALNKINEILCCLDVAACEPQKPLRDKLMQLQLLETQLQAAKVEVEYCHHPKKGMEIYNYVMKMLDKLACGCGCGCSDNY